MCWHLYSVSGIFSTETCAVKFLSHYNPKKLLSLLLMPFMRQFCQFPHLLIAFVGSKLSSSLQTCVVGQNFGFFNNWPWWNTIGFATKPLWPFSDSLIQFGKWKSDWKPMINVLDNFWNTLFSKVYAMCGWVLCELEEDLLLIHRRKDTFFISLKEYFRTKLQLSICSFIHSKHFQSNSCWEKGCAASVCCVMWRVRFKTVKTNQLVPSRKAILVVKITASIPFFLPAKSWFDHLHPAAILLFDQKKMERLIRGNGTKITNLCKSLP